MVVAGFAPPKRLDAGAGAVEDCAVVLEVVFVAFPPKLENKLGVAFDAGAVVIAAAVAELPPKPLNKPEVVLDAGVVVLGAAVLVLDAAPNKLDNGADEVGVDFGAPKRLEVVAAWAGAGAPDDA